MYAISVVCTICLCVYVVSVLCVLSICLCVCTISVLCVCVYYVCIFVYAISLCMCVCCFSPSLFLSVRAHCLSVYVSNHAERLGRN